MTTPTLPDERVREIHDRAVWLFDAIAPFSPKDYGHDEVAALCDALLSTRAALAAREEECGRLRGLLRDYGGHAPECRIDQGPYYNYNIGPCTCGWDSSMATLTPAQPKEAT